MKNNQIVCASLFLSAAILYATKYIAAGMWLQNKFPGSFSSGRFIKTLKHIGTGLDKAALFAVILALFLLLLPTIKKILIKLYDDGSMD